MENTKLPVDNAALDAAYIENEPDEFITDMTDSHNGIDTADNCMKITLSVLTNFYQKIYGIFHDLICRH